MRFLNCKDREGNLRVLRQSIKSPVRHKNQASLRLLHSNICSQKAQKQRLLSFKRKTQLIHLSQISVTFKDKESHSKQKWTIGRISLIKECCPSRNEWRGRATQGEETTKWRDGPREWMPCELRRNLMINHYGNYDYWENVNATNVYNANLYNTVNKMWLWWAWEEI